MSRHTYRWVNLGYFMIWGAVPMTVIAFLSDPQVVERILDHLALPSTPPLLAESFPLNPAHQSNGLPIRCSASTRPNDART